MTRLTTDRVARHLAVALVQRQLPTPGLDLARELLSEIDGTTRVKALESRVRAVIDSGFRAGSWALADAASARDTKLAIGGIKATAALAAALGLHETHATATETQNHTPANAMEEAAS